MTKITVGEAIRALRNAHKMSQEELAHGAMVSRNYIAMIERGDKVPSFKVLDAIAETLGTKPKMLLEHDPIMDHLREFVSVLGIDRIQQIIDDLKAESERLNNEQCK